MPKELLLPNAGLVSFRNEFLMENQCLLEDLTINWPCKNLLLNLKEQSFLEEAEHGREKMRGPFCHRCTDDADFLCMSKNVTFE